MKTTPASRLRLLILGLACTLGLSAAHGQFALKGELLLEENFQKYEKYPKDPQVLKPGWTIGAGHAQWERTSEGVRSIYTEGHMPVLKVNGDFGDVVIEVDFKFEGQAGRWGGARVSVSNSTLYPRAYISSVWANDSNDARPRGLVLENDEWKPGFITLIDRQGLKLEPGKWYTLRYETVGDTVVASCNGTTVHGTFPKFGIRKASLSLGVGTSPHELRNLRIFSATLNPAWTAPKSAAARKAAPSAAK